jgi:hypothetical protein
MMVRGAGRAKRSCPRGARVRGAAVGDAIAVLDGEAGAAAAGYGADEATRIRQEKQRITPPNKRTMSLHRDDSGAGVAIMASRSRRPIRASMARLAKAARAAGRAVAKPGSSTAAIRERAGARAPQWCWRPTRVTSMPPRRWGPGRDAGSAKLDPARLEKMARALDEIAGLPDQSTSQGVGRPNGLQVGRQRIPLGVSR